MTLFRNWVEFFFFVLMVIGFLIAIASPSAIISYVVVFVSGIIGGTLLYERKTKLTIPYYIIIIGFLIGFTIGTYYGSKRIIIILFVLGVLLGYHLYNKGYIKDLPY